MSSENGASHTWQTNSFSILRINWFFHEVGHFEHAIG